MRISSTSPRSAIIISFLAFSSFSFAADADKTATATACTATSTSGAFFDLRPDVAIKPNSDGSRPAHSNNAPLEDYRARGYDYGSNFTLNICDPVVKPIEDVKGVTESRWSDVSAYYTSDGRIYSLGSTSGKLVTRGKELILQYSGGSPCGKKLSDRSPAFKDPYRWSDYEETNTKDGKSSSVTKSDMVSPGKLSSDESQQRKSATIFFSCDRDPGLATAQVSFIATDPDECAYVFKIKSRHACAGAEPHKPGSVGPGSIFAIILAIAVLVYLLGGIFYQRTVAHARGWKQLPNYTFWASVWSFICDVFVIATSSCARLLPSRRGYHYLAGSGSSTRGRNSREDENRLIDQYDEEWED